MDVITEHVGNLSTCTTEILPSIDEYYTAFNIWGFVLFSMGGVAVSIIFASYIDTLKHVMRNAPPIVKTHSAFVVSVYPVVGLATYCAIIVPRAQLLAEAVTQGMFMASMYQLFCLLVAYCGGEAELIRNTKPDSLNTRVGPCCCWPCCCCLPLLAVNKTHVRMLRVLVLQLPVVQGLIYMVLLVMWAEEQSLYQVNYVYMQPIVVISILCGIWGMIMTMKMLTEVLKEHHMQGKFFVLQLVLLLGKLQGIIAKVLVSMDFMPCKPPITPTVYANLLYNSVMIWEMVLLSIVARIIYKKAVPDPNGSVDELPQQICTIGIKSNIPPVITECPEKRKLSELQNNNGTHFIERF